MTRLISHLIRLLIPALWFLASVSYADYKAPSDYTLREWNESSGLPSNEAASLFQDEKGYLWVVTSAGYAKFDGTTFESFQMPPEVSARGLIYCSGKTYGMFQGMISPANIIVSTNGPGPSPVDGYYAQDEKGEFKFHQVPELADKSVRTVFVTETGTLWLGCEDGTLFRRTSQETETYAPPAGGPAGKRVPVFATDKAGQIWVAAGFYLARFEGNQWSPINTGTNDPQVRICSSHTGGPWLITRTTLLKWKDGRFEEIIKLPELAGAHYVQTTIEDRHGDLWIGTRSQGLFRVTNSQLVHVATSNEDIAAIYEDAEDDIWVATNGGGLNRLRPKAHQLYGQTSGLKDNFSYTVTEDSNGIIWLANRDGGVARILGDGTLDLISKRANWRSFSAMSVAPALGGGIWITTGIGVYKTDALDPEKILRLNALNNFKTIRSTLVARNGDYWFSVDPDRVARWRENQLAIFGPNEGFDGREVRAITEDPSGAIWLGAADGRLFRNNGERFERVPFAGSDDAGAIQALYFEPDGTLLAGSTRRGVFVLPPANRTAPRVLNSSSGLPNNNITQILADDYDRFWFASRGGIFWIHRAQVRDFVEGKPGRVHAVMLGVDDGLPELTCLGLFQPSALKSRDGKLWFATRRGVLCTDPTLTTGEDELPPVKISTIGCDGRTQPTTNDLKIKSTVRKTEIRLSVLCLSAPERVIVRCRLDGFDNDWVIQKNSRVATYPRLPPGQYVFRAMASNGNGVWNDQAELLTITVTPPWWQSLWARLLYLISLVIVVGSVVRARSHRRLRRKLENLEQERAIEQERTRIARNIHDELGASLTHISLLTQAAQHIHPAQTASLEKIYEATQEITRAMDEIVWAVNPKCDDLESLAYYIGNFAQRLLSTAGIRCRLDLPSTPPPLHLPSPVRHNLYLCCKEALNNAVKHAQAEQVSVTMKVDGRTLRIAISDNGRGLGSAAAGERTRLTPASGLDNLHRRMTEIGGSCELSPQTGGGLAVTFAITLPAS